MIELSNFPSDNQNEMQLSNGQLLNFLGRIYSLKPHREKKSNNWIRLCDYHCRNSLQKNAFKYVFQGDFLFVSVPLWAGVDPLSSRSFTDTTPVSINIFNWARSPLYAATCAGKARSKGTRATVKIKTFFKGIITLLAKEKRKNFGTFYFGRLILGRHFFLLSDKCRTKIPDTSLKHC